MQRLDRGCIYLFRNPSGLTLHLFFVWKGIGILLYAVYGVRKSRLRLRFPIQLTCHPGQAIGR